jgi:hypothetical protein
MLVCHDWVAAIMDSISAATCRRIRNRGGALPAWSVGQWLGAGWSYTRSGCWSIFVNFPLRAVAMARPHSILEKDLSAFTVIITASARSLSSACMYATVERCHSFINARSVRFFIDLIGEPSLSRAKRKSQQIMWTMRHAVAPTRTRRAETRHSCCFNSKSTSNIHGY